MSSLFARVQSPPDQLFVRQRSSSPAAATRYYGEACDPNPEQKQRRRFRDCGQLEINRRDLNRQTVRVRILAAAAGRGKIEKEASSPQAASGEVEERPVNL